MSYVTCDGEPVQIGYCLYKCKRECHIRNIYQQGRADAIDTFTNDVINKINFEERWLSDCKSNNSDTNIAFSSLRTFCENRAEQIKERKNE